MDYKKDHKLWKYYREGYNNPSQFTGKTLSKNDDITKAIVAGVCDRKKDDQNRTTQFK